MYINSIFFILFNMKKYYRYFLIVIFAIFSFYYTDKTIELSKYNNAILVSLNDYADIVNSSCIEGEINDDGVILGMSGLSVDKEKSYSYMKGIGFREDLIQYKKEKCILNKEDNVDKYILSGNKYERKISIVIDINNYKYYEDMINKMNKESFDINLLVSFNDLDRINYKTNLLLKTNTDNIKDFKSKVKDFYCVKYNNFNVLEYCKKEKINTIKIKNYIEKDLLLNTKKILDKGIIIFIKENETNNNELTSTINYIKSRGYKIVSMNELLS